MRLRNLPRSFHSAARLGALAALSLGLPATAAAQELSLPDGPAFLAGGAALGASGVPVAVRLREGERATLSFFYSSPEDDLPADEQLDHLQGFSMVACYDCRLRCVRESFRVPEPSIVTALGVDFVSFQCDNDGTDGDGCELSLAMLVEAVPPFEGETLPPTFLPLVVAAVDFEAAAELECGEELAIEFCDGKDVSARVPLYNVYSAANHAFPAATVDGRVVVEAPGLFLRGDCNFDAGLNISDPIAAVNFVFLRHVYGFEPICHDACDANDDGRIDLSDALSLLRWLFLGRPSPPAPGVVERGPDPSSDFLECALPCE